MKKMNSSKKALNTIKAVQSGKRQIIENALFTGI